MQLRHSILDSLSVRGFTGVSCALVVLGLVGPVWLSASTTVYYLPPTYPEVCGQNLTSGEPVCDEGATESATAFCEAELTGLDLARAALDLATCSGEGERASIPGVNYLFLVDDRPLTQRVSNLLGDAIRDLGDGPLVFPTRTNESASTQGILIGERFYREGNDGQQESDAEWRTRVAALESSTGTAEASGPIRVFLVDPRLPAPADPANEGAWGSIPISGNAQRLRELCAGNECPTLIRTYEELTNGRVGREVGRLMAQIGVLDHIEYILVNDSTQDINQATIREYRFCQSELRGTGRIGAWPCARRERVSGRSIGKVKLGELHGENLSEGGRDNAEWDSVLMHETVHTLDQTRWDTQHYGPAYGPDGTHYYSEVLPDPHAVFKEGVANFVGMHFAPSVARSSTARLSSNGWMYRAEAGTQARDAAGEGERPRRVTYIDGSGDRQTTTYYFYRWRSLDAESLLRNEMVAAVALYYIADSVTNGYDQLLSSFSTTNWRSRTLLTLIGDFVAESDWEWRLGTRDDAASLFALAVVDIVTHFDFSDSDFRATLIREAALDGAVVDEYLGELRPRLRSTVQAEDGGNLSIDDAVQRARRFVLGDS